MKRNNLHLVVGFIALAVSALFIVGGVMLLSIPVVSEHLTKFWAIALAVLCFIVGFFAISIAFAGFTYKLKDSSHANLTDDYTDKEKEHFSIMLYEILLPESTWF